MTEEIINEDNSEKRIYNGKLYKSRGLLLAIIVGGPFAAAYIISRNFKVLGDKRKAKLTWLFLVFFFVLIFLSDFVFPELPNFVFGLLSLVISISFMNKYQEKKIEEYIQNGNTPYSNWRGLFVGIFSLLILLVLIAIPYYINDQFENKETKNETFARGNNSIAYYPDQFEEGEIRVLTNELYKFNFIQDSSGAGIFIVRENDKTIYYFPYNDTVWVKTEDINYFKGLKDSIQKDLHKSSIGIYLCDTVYNIKRKI
ncbi:MAG: hypothetical protein JNJ40_01605 [Bacteroidia bacterium]|nr:hypothetical protein [Bacteroidia bacterium]